MELLQPLARHMGVDLRGGNVSMAQQQLHHAQLSAVIEQTGSKSMAWRMRRQRLAFPGSTAYKKPRQQILPPFCWTLYTTGKK